MSRRDLKMQQRAEQSRTGYLNKKAKMELAFKIVECGLSLLGSRLFQRLSSKHIRRFSSGQSNQPTFMLRTAKQPPREFILAGLGLEEISQLFRLGLHLMQIALETPVTERQDGDCYLGSSSIGKRQTLWQR